MDKCSARVRTQGHPQADTQGHPQLGGHSRPPTCRRTHETHVRPQNSKTHKIYVLFKKKKLFIVPVVAKRLYLYYFRLHYCLIKLVLFAAFEATLTSKLKSELSLLASMNFYSVNCASNILNPVGASIQASDFPSATVGDSPDSARIHFTPTTTTTRRNSLVWSAGGASQTRLYSAVTW